MPRNLNIVSVSKTERVDLERFAKIVIEKWQFNILKRKLVDSGDLLRSFEYTVSCETDGDKVMIAFIFNYYFRALEMGVGKNVSFGEESYRRRHKIYTKTFNAEFHKLIELYQDYYSKLAVETIALNIAT